MINVSASAWAPNEADVVFDQQPCSFHITMAEAIMLAANEAALRISPYGWDANTCNSKPALSFINGRPC